MLMQSYCTYMPEQRCLRCFRLSFILLVCYREVIVSCAFIYGTYIFKVALHKGQSNIIGRSTCVLGVDVFLICSGQSLWHVTTTTVPQHWNTHIYTLFRNANHMLISCHHHIYGTHHLNTIMKYHVKVRTVTNVTPMLADPKPYHTEYSAIIRSLSVHQISKNCWFSAENFSTESDMTARKLPSRPWGVSRVLKSHNRQIKDQWLFIKHHVNFITAPAEKSQKQLKHCC